MKPQVCFRVVWTAALILAGLASAGCGGSAKPHGKLLLNGEPYKVGSAEYLRVTFYSDAEPGKQISTVAEVSPEGAFTLPGPTSTGVAPGKYHVTVTSTAGPAAGGTADQTAGPPAPAGGDKFQGKYSDPAKTPLTCEITAANPAIVIDVGKGMVSTGS